MIRSCQENQEDLNEIISRQESTETFFKILINNLSKAEEKIWNDIAMIQQEKLLQKSYRNKQ